MGGAVENRGGGGEGLDVRCQVSRIIIQHIVTMSRYSHGALNIHRHTRKQTQEKGKKEKYIAFPEKNGEKITWLEARHRKQIMIHPITEGDWESQKIVYIIFSPYPAFS